MERARKTLLVFVLVLSTALGKDLHTKEKENSAVESFAVNNLNDNEIFKNHERYSRHVEAVTETVVTHLLQQMRKRYHLRQNEPNSLKQMMKNLKMSLKKYMHRRRLHQKPREKTTKINK